jgi:hypothetical protein
MPPCSTTPPPGRITSPRKGSNERRERRRARQYRFTRTHSSSNAVAAAAAAAISKVSQLYNTARYENGASLIRYLTLILMLPAVDTARHHFAFQRIGQSCSFLFTVDEV